jgi:hypothetical protein
LCGICEPRIAGRQEVSSTPHPLSTRQLIDAAKAYLADPSFTGSSQNRHKVLCYFLNRAVQLGEACLLVSEFRIPLLVLERVLCENFFRMYWASLSDENAGEYIKSAISEVTKMLQKNLQNERVKARRKSSNEDVTTEFLPTLAAHIVSGRRLDKLAGELGLGAVYDLIYRSGSLEVHANTFGQSQSKSPAPTDSIANALLKIILLVADNNERALPANEILLSLFGPGLISS